MQIKFKNGRVMNLPRQYANALIATGTAKAVVVQEVVPGSPMNRAIQASPVDESIPSAPVRRRGTLRRRVTKVGDES